MAMAVIVKWMQQRKWHNTYIITGNQEEQEDEK